MPNGSASGPSPRGPLLALRTVLRDAPGCIRCAVVYYGGMSIMNPRYFSFSPDEEPLVRDFSPVYHLAQQDPANVPPLFVAKAGLDRPFLNESIDEFVAFASARTIPITFMNHPAGEHGFDILNDDARSREIIKASLAFVHEHLDRL